MDNFQLLAHTRGERLTPRFPNRRFFSPFEKWPALPGAQ